MSDTDYRRQAQELVDNVDAIEKLLKEIHELKRTRSEAEAAAEIRGHKAGVEAARRQFRALVGSDT